MKKRDCTPLAALAGALLLLPTLALAQSVGDDAGRFGLGAGGDYVAFGGDDLEGIESGVGVRAGARYVWPGGLSLGVGGSLSFHGDETFDEDDITRLGLFAEPRVLFGYPEASVRPFLGARAGYARLSADGVENVEEIEVDFDGFEVGPVAGAEVWLSDGLTLELTGRFSFLSFGDPTVTVEGTEVEGGDFVEGPSGSELALGAGLNLLFP